MGKSMTPMVNGKEVAVGPPLWLLAEVTYACPLHCVFCYNPVDYTQHGPELTTQEWLKVLRDARAAGSVQCGFSGGEPLVRDDLEELVAEAHKLGFYTNLLTSGIGFTPERAKALKLAGLDHVQLSFQDSTRELNDFLSHTKTFALKQKAAQLIQDNGWPMVLNCVIHRLNIDYIDKIIELAVDLGAEYLELAKSQYYSWAQLNREGLMPSREQLQRAERVTNEYREKLGDKLRIFFVVPDYYETRPKKCMNGWGEVFMIVTANGDVLPCHSARSLPNMQFPNVRDSGLEYAWKESPAFNKYRGDSWMKEPCRSCSEKENDLGGCRCQAFLLSGDADVADPVCSKSPFRHLIDQAIEDSKNPVLVAQPIVFRNDKNSKKIIAGELNDRVEGFYSLP